MLIANQQINFSSFYILKVKSGKIYFGNKNLQTGFSKEFDNYNEFVNYFNKCYKHDLGMELSNFK